MLDVVYILYHIYSFVNYLLLIFFLKLKENIIEKSLMSLNSLTFSWQWTQIPFIYQRKDIIRNILLFFAFSLITYDCIKIFECIIKEIVNILTNRQSICNLFISRLHNVINNNNLTNFNDHCESKILIHLTCYIQIQTTKAYQT